ncbi:hypothetical protein FGG08_001073 [Glutinoglossum americanum]|uniref:Ribosomal RNA-processing protein 12 n=1 Tax=Glutinoglossum americanum TaxID=1670608 RepID=A0A9P8L5N8_9PEZI|nr:hypothetical protein FGG08_001073 [Glutinoglossum americanum]
MESVSLASKLDKIRSPNLQNQRQTAVVLSAVEDTLRDQKTEFAPTAYFAAVLALLNQSISSSAGIVNKDLATSVVYLLDLITPFTPAPLLRSKFSQILTHLAPALTHPEAEAPLLKSSIGCLESLLTAQDSAAWQLSQSQIGPRRAIAGLLNLAVDHRPKVRKRAQDALTKVLKNPPPSPSVDHPAADMCAETSLRSLSQLAKATGKKQKHRSHKDDHHHDPSLIHSLQLVKTIAAASGGWPARKIEPLCEVLLGISKSSNEYLAMAAFEVFEVIFEGMSDELSSVKLPRLLEVISEMRPSQNDSQLLPPWIAVLSRGYEVSAQINPDETFLKLPELFDLISGFLESSSHNVRVSASECLVSFLSNCVPHTVLLNPSVFDEKVFEKLARSAASLLTVKYQASWLEVFNVLEAMFDSLRWRSDPVLSGVVKTIGELRGNDSFNGKKEADRVLGKAVRAMGSEIFLSILPLNLSSPGAGQPGRVWMLPILRDYVGNTHLAHFRSEFVPLSEVMFQRVIGHGEADKTLEVKIFETVIQQIWSILPGYCDLPLDLPLAFDQSFAEMVSNVLYKQDDLRPDVCKALQTLVDSNKAILALEPDDDLILQRRVSKADARSNINHLASFAGNLLAVLFNVYSQTLPQYRGFILKCISAYLSITPEKELMSTFVRVTTMLESSLGEPGQTQAEKQKLKKAEDKMPPVSHNLMDLVITISIYLPRESFGTLFNIASLIIMKGDDPQLQKKAYKLIPKLSGSEAGKAALKERSAELQHLLISSAEKASAPSRRDRLEAISRVVEFLPDADLHFIPDVLSEVVISAKEVNEKARTAAFDLLVLMGEKMRHGGVVVNSKVAHMPDDAPSVPGTLEEYFTMVSAGLAGSTPHMISASITALTRILYHFRESLKEDLMTDMVSTMDLFLTSNNREIVRSVLGFVKVSVISLPPEMMLPRLKTLIPNLMGWSHEHKAHFKAKVKHILERMIRRFGHEIVERNTPDDDKKLIVNIRKTRDRRKRKKEAGGDEEIEGDAPKKRASKFETEFDEAIYGSESEDGSDISDDEIMGKKTKAGKAKKGETFIMEDDEPLDLLDRKALANISTTRPQKVKQPRRNMSAKTNEDGKLVLGVESSDDDAVMMDISSEIKKDEDTLGGINAYIDAIKGKDAVQRGQRGRLKFSNKRSKGGDGGDEMEVDEEEVVQKLKAKQETNGKGLPKRRGLGMSKVKGGRVQKSPRGKFGRR